jgi:hypothetical protein
VFDLQLFIVQNSYSPILSDNSDFYLPMERIIDDLLMDFSTNGKEIIQIRVIFVSNSKKTEQAYLFIML